MFGETPVMGAVVWPALEENFYRVANALLSRRRRDRPHVVFRSVPSHLELFCAEVTIDGEPISQSGKSVASVPSSPHLRDRFLRENKYRVESLLAKCRELLRLEIRCVRGDDDDMSKRVAKVLRRKRIPPLLGRRSSSDIETSPCGRTVARRYARFDRADAVVRSEAPVPPRMWIYFHVDWTGESQDLVEVSLKLVDSVGAVVSLSSLGVLETRSGARTITTMHIGTSPHDHQLRNTFRPGDSVGFLVMHGESGGTVKVLINGRVEADVEFSQESFRLVYPTLALRSMNVAATCAFTADDISLLTKFRLREALDEDGMRPAVYALDGTRILDHVHETQGCHFAPSQ